MKSNRKTRFLILAASLMLCSCSDSAPAEVVPTSEASAESGHATPRTSKPLTPTASATTGDDSTEEDSTDDSTGGDPTEEDSTGDLTADLLLAQQITATGAGNGSGPDCRATVTSESPIAYLSDGVTEGLGLTMPFHVGVCLRGFDQDSPVALTVEVAGQSYRTSVHLSSDSVEYNFFETVRQALFNGTALNARLLSETDTFQTESWEFVPPSEVRDGLVEAGELILRATQGSLSSSVAQPVTVLPGPQQSWLASEGEFAIWGFTPGLRVPVGLYRRDDPAGDTHSLVREIGVVTMPASSFAVFTIPDEVMRDFGGDEDYCVSAPIQPVYNCWF